MDNNVNQVAAAVLADLVKSFFVSVKDKSSSFIGKKLDLFKTDFDQYLTATYERCNYVKTIITKDRPYELSDIYVSSHFRCGEDIVSDDEVCQIVRDNKRVLVTGFGGIGKTVFSKYLWMSVFRESHGRIPVFLELRRLNGITSINLEGYIKNLLFPTAKSDKDDIFNYFLNEGKFIFVLDALDEVNEEKRKNIEESILDMSFKYPSCGFVITSRHSGDLESWERFFIYKSCPFSKSQVKELIANVYFDEPTKKKFIKKIVEDSYESYRTFLETPLLSLMMLMTFSQYGELPEKVHLFYRYAFNTLYSWHDGSKEAFQRERRSGLILDQFEKVFSIFSMLSYYDQEHSFDEDALIKYIERVKGFVDFKFDTLKFIYEAEQSVNLIFKEGGQYAFTHRSFQEYFTAFAISSYFSNRVIDLVNSMAFRSSDTMLSIFYDLNPVIGDENYIIPLYESNKGEIELYIKEKDPVEFLRISGFVVEVVISYLNNDDVVTRKKAKNKKKMGGHAFSIGFHDNSVIRIAETVCSMHARRYSLDVESHLSNEESHDWLDQVQNLAKRMVDKTDIDIQIARVRFNYSSKSVELFNHSIKDSHPADVKLLRTDEGLPPLETSEKYASSLKNKMVFFSKIYSEVRKKNNSRRISLEQLLSGD